MTTTHTPFTWLSPFTCSAPPEAKVASPPKLLKPNKKMQEPLKSPSSLVFYSLFSYVLPIVLTTHMHVRTECSLSSVSHSFPAMRNNLQKPSHSPPWTWTTLSTCLSPLYPVSSPGLSKFLFTDSLTHLDGQDLTPRFLISPVLPRKPSTSPLFPGSCTFSRTFFPLASSRLSNITSLKISSAMILPVLITSNPTSFSLGPPLNPRATPISGIFLGLSPLTLLASKRPWNFSTIHTPVYVNFSAL